MLRTWLAIVSAALLAAMVVTGCGVRFNDGDAVTQQRTVAKFDRVCVDGSVDVDVRYGEQASVTVSGGDKVIDDVQTHVRDGMLFVDRRGGSGSTVVLGGADLKVTVVVPRLAQGQVDGSGNLDIDLGSLRRPRLDLQVHGSGDISARGEVDRLDAKVEGSGDLNLEELRARIGTVAVHGSGDAGVFVVEQLDATIEGSGDIEYRGDPRVNQRVDGSGDVSRR
jgi:hypothetical protein